MNKYIRYFKSPIHGISLSTSYGLPNSLVHLPVILMVPYIGIMICGAEAKSLLPVYFIIALYAGRDLVIMSYRNYVIPIVIWVLFIPFIVYKTEISNLLTVYSQFATVVAAAAAAVFLVYIALTVK